MIIEWKKIYENNFGATTWRTKVFGGWIVINQQTKGRNDTECSVFVPDKDHEWVIDEN
jgi:hypothetical protein